MDGIRWQVSLDENTLIELKAVTAGKPNPAISAR